MDNTALYYDKFLTLVCEYWRDEIKSAAPGHCMKITGLPIQELRKLLPKLRLINPDIDIFILSDDLRGDEYIHATKLIELRNNEQKGLLVLIPSNSSTSAEDSYGDATFKDLAVKEIQEPFIQSLRRNVPEEKYQRYASIMGLLARIGRVNDKAEIDYLLFLEQQGWSDKAWGEGLFIFGLFPDSLLWEKFDSHERRLVYNSVYSEGLCDFSVSMSDKITQLPVKAGTIQRALVKFFTVEPDLTSSVALTERVYEKYPDLYFSKWELVKNPEDDEKVFVTAEIMPGKDLQKELVKDVEGNYIVQIPPGKSSKVKVRMNFNPAPKECSKIRSFQIELVKLEGMINFGVLKKGKLPATTGASKTITVPIPGDSFDNGDYFFRVHVLDEDSLVLDTDNPFKYENIEEKWQEAHEADETLTRDQFQQDHTVLRANETNVFNIRVEQGDDTDTTDDDLERQKRTHPDNLLQAFFHYSIEQLRKGGNIAVPEVKDTEWKEGSLNNVFSFDFGSAYAYTIQMPKKLLELERAFYKHSGKLGHVNAEISGNPTDTKLQDWHFEALPSSVEIPAELINKRKELFQLIQDSAASESGVVNTFAVYEHASKVKEYINDFTQWLTSLNGLNFDEATMVAIPNIDTVSLNIEMPDGSKSIAKLISPLHPLRLGWMVNIFELYKDWENRTLDNPDLKKQWYRNLDKLFLGELTMEVSPLVLTEGALEIYQYVGELTFGWGLYAQPTVNHDDLLASEFRQLKSYLASLFNIARDKQIDSDMSLSLVKRHLENYVKSHPYTRKLVINLFNAGDANVFADALVKLEQSFAQEEYDYEIRLFADDKLIIPGEALSELLNPESVVADSAETFSQASKNRLFPKLRFSINSISDFISDYQKYQAHLSFLINPFPVKTATARPEELARSFFVNGTVFKSNVSEDSNPDGTVWSRYYANRPIPEPVSPFANDTVALFANIQGLIGRIVSSTSEHSVVATTLVLNQADAMLLSFVHEVSDWVVTFDKNMGPEFYDLPVSRDSKEIPYLLDYIPGQERSSISSFLTTRPTSEVMGLMAPLFREFNVDIADGDMFKSLLEDVRTISSSLVMQVNTTQNKAFEVLGTTLTKRFLAKKGLMTEAFLIPIDLHKELFEDLDSESKERADTLLVNIDTENKEIIFTVVEIKCRKNLSETEAEELQEKMQRQIENTILALKTHFEVGSATEDRLDRELKTLELSNLLTFYASRADRYHVLDTEIAYEYRRFLADLGNDYNIRFKKLGLIYNFSQEEKQIKDSWGDTQFYSMGKNVIQDILSDDVHALETSRLNESEVERDFMSFFEPDRKERIVTRRRQEAMKNAIISNPKEDEPVETPVSVEVEQSKAVETISTNNVETAEVHVENPEVESKDSNNKTVNPVTKPEEDADTDVPAVQPIPGPITPDVDVNYTAPRCDILLGKNESSAQFGILGKMLNSNRLVGIDLDGCNTFSLFGVQGAGKSYTIGSVTEMVLKQFSNVNKLQAPLASVIFHYSDSMDYAPEFTSMIYPNDEQSQLARLKEQYGAVADSVDDVILLTPESKVEQRKTEYPGIEVYPIAFDSSELQVKDWMFLLGAMGNDSAYLRVLTQIMRAIRNDLSLKNIRRGVKTNSSLSTGQKELAEMRISFAEEYIRDGEKLQRHLRPGRLIIVDLRDEFIQKDEALGLFVVMLNIFSSVMEVEGKRFNKFIVFDEAHKYMNNKDLVGSITTAIREMRHKGVSIMIASQDPMSLPTEIIELSSVVILHRFNSPQWVKHVQKSITSLNTLTATEMAQLGSGEAYIWAVKATDKAFTTRPVKIQIRPRVTKHGGDTIQAVK